MASLTKLKKAALIQMLDQRGIINLPPGTIGKRSRGNPTRAWCIDIIETFKDRFGDTKAATGSNCTGATILDPQTLKFFEVDRADQIGGVITASGRYIGDLLRFDIKFRAFHVSDGQYSLTPECARLHETFIAKNSVECLTNLGCLTIGDRWRYVANNSSVHSNVEALFIVTHIYSIAGRINIRLERIADDRHTGEYCYHDQFLVTPEFLFNFLWFIPDCGDRAHRNFTIYLGTDTESQANDDNPDLLAIIRVAKNSTQEYIGFHTPYKRDAGISARYSERRSRRPVIGYPRSLDGLGMGKRVDEFFMDKTPDQRFDFSGKDERLIEQYLNLMRSIQNKRFCLLRDPREFCAAIGHKQYVVLVNDGGKYCDEQ